MGKVICFSTSSGERPVANHRSAIKRIGQNARRQARNSAIRSRVRTAVRTFRETVATPADSDALKLALNRAAREIRVAAAKGVLPKRTASRRVSRLMLAFNKTLA